MSGGAEAVEKAALETAPEAEAPGVGVDAGAAPAFEVLDGLGLCALGRRSPTFDGGVPLRAAQGCAPLLAGNALGWTVSLRRTLRLRRGLLGFTLVEDEEGALLRRAHRAALAALRARGLLGGAWARLLADGPLFRVDGRLWLFTGLLCRPRPGLWLWVAGAGNRRNLLVDVGEAVLPESGALAPLCLELSPAPGCRELVLSGELATLQPLRPGPAFERLALAAAPEVGRVHLDFYDAEYFARKRSGEVTRKYRRLIGGAADEESPSLAAPQVVVAGPGDVTFPAGPRALMPEGPRAVAPQGGVARARFHSPLAFSATYDGLNVTLDYDAAALRRLAGEVERVFRDVYGPKIVDEHRGALWYLTKFFTPHPPGEPHFFVKPLAFTRTAAGEAAIIEGPSAVLRGVVRTDRFFATPAVFHLRRPGDTVVVDEGAPLVDVIPLPMELQAPEYTALQHEGLPRLPPPPR